MLLLFDLFFMVRAVIADSFVPLMPIIAGVLITAGLLAVIYAEGQARDEDKKEHRRLARVAHQLESPLHVLQEDFQQLTAKAAKLPAEERMKLKRMETKTKVLLENIRDVFMMLRAEQGAVSQDIRTYDMCTLVKEAADRVASLASAHNVELLHKAHCSDAPVKVDKQLFLIALVHILENAILYSLTPGIVNVAIVRGKTNVRVIVQDRGIGVKNKDTKSIFRPFARGEAADQYDPDGIGVGLTLSQLLIKEMSGSLEWRRREHSAGTEFSILLPLQKT